MQVANECKKEYKYCDEVLQSRLVYIRDRDVRAKWLNIQDGQIMFDIGSEYGYWSLAALAQGARMVYAIEKDPVLVTAIRANLAANSNFRERCSVVKNYSTLDSFIEGLSTPPTTVDYIRLAAPYADFSKEFVFGANKTLKRYRPKVIGCLSQTTDYSTFAAPFVENYTTTLKEIAVNNELYSLVTIR